MNKKRTIVNSALVLGIAGAGFAGYSTIGTGASAAAVTNTVVTAQTGNVLSKVTGTGNVITPSQASVAFDSAVSSNKVTSVLVAQGDKVTAGQPLAKVDDTTVTQALAAAQAQVASAQAALEKASNPATATVVAQDAATANQAAASVQSASAGVSSAQTAYASNETSLNASLTQAQQAYNAAQAKASQDLANQQVSVDQAQAQLDADSAKLATAQAALAAAPLPTVPTVAPSSTVPGSSSSVPGPVATTSPSTNNAAQSAVDTAQAAVNKDTQQLQSVKGQQASLALSTTQSVQQATNSVTNAQNSLTSKLASDRVAIDNANRQVTSAKASQQVTLTGNAAKELAPTAGDLAAAKAALVSAQNGLVNAQRNEDNTTLKAPASGTIAALTAQVGSPGGSSPSASSSSATSSSATGLFTLTDLTSLQIKVGFSEADAANVKIGQAATVTFDSLTGVLLTCKVSQLDLTSTTVSNVVTYYAYITLDPSPSLTQVKPGMTANVTVVVNHADNVVYLPTTAVTARGANASVNVEIGTDPTKTTATPITVGLRGDNTIEIKTGLKAGDKIVIVRTAVAAGTTAAGGARAGATGAAAGAAGITGGAGGAGGGAGPRAGG